MNNHETIAGYPVHPSASLLPLMDSESLCDLSKDIARHGLIDPIIIHEGHILDGRNRAMACEMAGVEIETTPWFNPKDMLPTEWVLSVNKNRRHLTPSQKAAVAIAALPLLREESKKRETLGNSLPRVDTGKSVEKAAEQTGANPDYVRRAEKINEQSPEVFNQVKDGKKTIPQAERELGTSKIISKGLTRLSSQKVLDAITEGISKFEIAFPDEREVLIADLETHLDRLKQENRKAA